MRGSRVPRGIAFALGVAAKNDDLGVAGADAIGVGGGEAS